MRNKRNPDGRLIFRLILVIAFLVAVIAFAAGVKVHNYMTQDGAAKTSTFTLP